MWNKILQTIKKIETPLPETLLVSGEEKLYTETQILTEVLNSYCSIDEIPPIDGVKNYFRVSYVRENFCPLKEFIRLKNNIVLTPKIPFLNDMLMKIGVFLHDYLRKIFITSRIQIEKIDEEFIDEEHWLKGHPDGVITMNNTKYLLEIKTTSNLPTAISQNYLLQVSLYKHLLELHEIQIDKILFLFVQYAVDRINQKPKLLEVIVDPVDITPTLSKLKEYVNCVQQNQFPQGICKSNSSLKFCEVKELCPAVQK